MCSHSFAPPALTYSNPEHVVQIRPVLGGERRYLKNRVGSVDTLAVLDLSRHVNVALQPTLPLVNDCKLHLTVVDQEFVTDLTRGNDLGVGEFHALVVSLGVVQVEAEFLVLLKVDTLLVRELSNTKLGALKIAEDSNRVGGLFLNGTNRVEELEL